MPDLSKAPVWFVENFLRNMFSDQARAKKYNIQQINNLISTSARKISTTPPPSRATTPITCAHCKKRFTSSSKPISCSRCSLYKHSGRCLPCPSVSQSLTSVVGSPAVSLSPVLPPVPATSSSVSPLSSLPITPSQREPRATAVLSLPSSSPPVCTAATYTLAGGSSAANSSIVSNTLTIPALASDSAPPRAAASSGAFPPPLS